MTTTRLYTNVIGNYDNEKNYMTCLVGKEGEMVSPRPTQELG